MRRAQDGARPNGKPLGNGSEGEREIEVFPMNPRRPEWPAADFIVGNPPFIGGNDVRARLGEGYAEALWEAHPR